MNDIREPIPGMTPQGAENFSLIFHHPDAELSAVGTQAGRSVGIDRLNQLMQAHQRFNEPVYVIDKQGREHRDDNFKLKHFLREIPDYVENAQRAGLTPGQATQLVVQLLQSNPYEFSDNNISVALMGRAFRHVAEGNRTLNARDIASLKKLVGKSAKYGVDKNAMYAYSLAQRIGMSTEESVAMISKPIDVDDYLSGYTFGSFCDALKTLNVADVNPDSVAKIFEVLGGERPYYRQNVYKAFEQVITFGCPSHDISPQEAIDAILKQVEAGKDAEEALLRFMGSEQPKLPGEQQVTIVNPVEERERYFVRKPGELEIAALPYQTHRPLNEGVRDLEKISVATIYRWEEVGEGFWVYDEATETWFSFGGQTELKPRGVRHNMLPYDIGQLSENPIMFHCHPKDFDVFIRPARGESIFPSQYEDQITEFLAATPSRADYAVIADLLERATSGVTPKSYIVHPLGITEFTYPVDVSKLKQMSIESRDIRDQAMLDFDWRTLERQGGVPRDLVLRLIDSLNRKFPEGFSVKFLPRGSNLKTK